MTDGFPIFDLSLWIKEIRDTECPIIPSNDCDPMAVLAGITPEVRRVIFYVVED